VKVPGGISLPPLWLNRTCKIVPLCKVFYQVSCLRLRTNSKPSLCRTLRTGRYVYTGMAHLKELPNGPLILTSKDLVDVGLMMSTVRTG
jgi:hypothetical protein